LGVNAAALLLFILVGVVLLAKRRKTALLLREKEKAAAMEELKWDDFNSDYGAIGAGGVVSRPPPRLVFDAADVAALRVTPNPLEDDDEVSFSDEDEFDDDSFVAERKVRQLEADESQIQREFNMEAAFHLTFQHDEDDDDAMREWWKTTPQKHHHHNDLQRLEWDDHLS